MARQWIRLNAFSAGLVLLLQLALSVLAFGDGGVCPSYPADPTWKNSISAQEMSVIKSKKRNLRLFGTFTQGVNVLLNRPAEGSNPNEVREMKMAVRTLYPSESRGIFKVSVILVLGFRQKDSRGKLDVYYGELGGAAAASQQVKVMGDGTFDEATGELCVLGCILSVCKYKLSLKYPTPKTILNLSTEGKLTSIGTFGDDTYFDPVSIHAYDDAPFQYTMNATVASVCPSLTLDVKAGKLWNEDDSDEVCSELFKRLWQTFEVAWNPACEGANCSPFATIGNAAGGKTPTFRFLKTSCTGNRMQAALDFTQHRFFFKDSMDPTASNGTLLAEGIWDSKTGQMCMIACRLSGKQDCKIAITAQIPLTFTVTQRSSVVGHIQSLRNETDPLYFKRITFRQVSRGFSNIIYDFPEETSSRDGKNQPEYVYTKVETAKKQCANSNEKESSSGNYPSGEDWNDFAFNGAKDLSIPQIPTEFYYMEMLTRGNKFIVKSYDHQDGANVTGLGVTSSTAMHALHDGIMNVSYSMDYTIGQQRMEVNRNGEGMAGEGIYDSNTGKLCLIGCRTVDLKHKDLHQLEGDARKDCQTFFSIQLPPKGSSKALKGTVKSLRNSTDPLYFKPESFSGNLFMQAADSLWRIDLEIVLSTLMLSLTVVLLLRQVHYSKRHPETLPYVSISMLLLLCLAHMIPLVVDFKALFNKQQFGGSNMYTVMESAGGWPEVNKVVIRFITMAAMLLQLRLLQLVWKSRTEARMTGKLAGDVQERRLLCYIVPLYVAGGLIAILVHAMLHFKPYEREFLWRSDQGGVWWDLHAYGGLVLDLHLLPQVIANVVWDTTEQAPLSKAFYVGMAVVRAVPHVYDLGRQFRFVPSFTDTYAYANPEWDFYSVTSDILIPCLVVLLSMLVSIQQRWGGRCVLPRRWRKHLEYEKVENPIAT